MNANEARMSMEWAKSQGINPFRYNLLKTIKIVAEQGLDSIDVEQLDELTIKWFQGLGYIYTKEVIKYYVAKDSGFHLARSLEEAKAWIEIASKTMKFHHTFYTNLTSAKISWGHFESSK